MLKRLELIGFKSFADKTCFEFGQGITAIVGPNGSGKSNLVDAVRWILGEQSAKSLRGGEMADVIFNGSSTRRSLGMAEVSLVLDNRRRTLAIDADEVQVTRRVYRSGEGEYLINRQPSRLRDIKEMFLGSGAGADAYSIIEQGRVDVLLQASTRERRAIFEEAAGISRFKAKKMETQRKLERVEQNLLRLRDIVDEVDRQLRSVKLQAAKAQRFREYSERLRQLRVALSLEEYDRLAAHAAQTASAIESLQSRLAAHTEETRRLDQELAELTQDVEQHDGQLRAGEAALADTRRHIAAEETTLQHERELTQSLEQDLAATRNQSHGLRRQLANLLEIVEDNARQLAEVEADCQRQNVFVEQLEDKLGELQERFADVRERVQADKNETMEQMRRAARLHNESVSIKAQADSLLQHRQRLEHKTALAAQDLGELDAEVQTLARAEAELQGQLAAARDRQAAIRRDRDAQAAACDELTQRLARLREQRSGIASRISVLEKLAEGLEGLSAGVREVLQEMRSGEPMLRQCIVGLVADLLTVQTQYAALIDLALGDRAQHFLVRDADALIAALASRTEPLPGRVSFLPLPPKPEGQRPSFTEADGFLFWASAAAVCEHPELACLPDCLLGNTAVVRDLAAARRLAAANPAIRFLTVQGELLEPTGVLTVGVHHAESGILSRKSQLRDLRRQSAEIDDELVRGEISRDELRQAAVLLESREQDVAREIQVLAEQAADLHARLAQKRQRHEGLVQEVELSHVELRQLDADLATLLEAQNTAEQDARDADARVQELQARLERAEKEIRSLELERHQCQQAATAAKVELAKSEERRAALALRHRQTHQDWQQRQTDLARMEEQIAVFVERLAQSQQTMLRASAALAQAYLDKEAAEARIHRLADELERLRGRRQQTEKDAADARRRLQELNEQFHARELDASDVQHRIAHLVERLRDEHDLDLPQLHQNYQPPPQPIDADAAQEEIAELKRKIGRLGSVSLDAIQELEELELRAKTLQVQHDDLAAAKKALDDIIDKINQDSKRLFLEMFQSICGHFQELFRKLFGGGMADIVLEDPEDVLESGVEIVARPPGKELRSISLMSGGEKTLTAVALLLAIFRSKPSPFCILDEVDAALDEANIGRFTAVLREFLDQSQFIIITHSKKTMAMADVLYGVTMQESGVSKRIAVRFEDWPDEHAPGTAPGTVPGTAPGTVPDTAPIAEHAA